MTDQTDSQQTALGWDAARIADPAGWATAEALDTQGGRDSMHYRDAAVLGRYPGQIAPGVDIGLYVRGRLDAETERQVQAHLDREAGQ